MTPDELKAAAGFAARQIPRDDIEAANLRTLAEAARCLADVIEYTERQMGPPAADWEHDPAKILQTVARFARGENFPDFSERG